MKGAEDSNILLGSAKKHLWMFSVGVATKGDDLARKQKLERVDKKDLNRLFVPIR